MPPVRAARGAAGEAGAAASAARSRPREGRGSFEGTPPEIVVHVTDLPRSALDEFEFWSDPASPGGRLVGTPNTGDELDPPPEDDPHVRFRVRVQHGVPYRCWIHMKVGKPKGKSQANLLYVQVTNAVDGRVARCSGRARGATSRPRSSSRGLDVGGVRPGGPRVVDCPYRLPDQR